MTATSTTHIRKLVSVNLYSGIIDQIKDWDTSQPVNGVGFYKKIEKYGHVELTICEAADTFKSSIINWNIPEEYLPDGYIREQIFQQIDFFANLVFAVKGKSSAGLVFDITNGSFTNRERHAFHMATTYALLNCFDKEATQLTHADKTYITRMQQEGIAEVRRMAKGLPQNEFFDNLKDTKLNYNILAAVQFVDKTLLYKCWQKGDYKLLNDAFINNLEPQILQYFIDNKIITKYKDLTDAGLAHIALLWNNLEFFTSLGIYDLSPLYGYYEIAKEDYRLKNIPLKNNGNIK